MKMLPIGIQDFPKLRSGDYLYVDKTKEISRLITTGNAIFLSRPRRFGKSLLISTMEEIFRGNRELFKGLYIYDKIDWQAHPVIRIDWSNIKHSTPEIMEESMSKYLVDLAESQQITLKNRYASDQFRELIARLHEISGQRVVVLIDEYDMPILDALNQNEQMVEIRSFLQSFYRILKGSDEHLRFVFLTGVSKFARVSIFSGLNNLIDITLEKPFATICGYTQAELEDSFAGYIDRLTEQSRVSREQVLDGIKQWYNGYSWDGATPVYNPFSTLLYFRNNTFNNYWFATGTPTFLVNMIKGRNHAEMVLQPITVSASSFNSSDPDTMDTEQLMFQTGYLTVKKIEEGDFGTSPSYVLGVPNQEVLDSLLTHLFADYSGFSLSQTEPMRDSLRRQLLNGDEDGFRRNLQEMFAHIPYQLHIPREAYYHSLLLLWLKLLGFDVQGEISTDKGRIDAAWTWKDQAVVAEIKYRPDEDGKAGAVVQLLDDAFAQMNDRKYYERYAGQHRVTLLAVAFAGKEVGCRIKTL